MKIYSVGKVFFSSLFLMAAVPGSILAQPGPGPEPKSLSIEELTAMRDQAVANGFEGGSSLTQIIENFATADTDQDGLLSPEEFRTYAEANGIMLPPPPHDGHRPPEDMTKDQLIEMSSRIAEIEGEAPAGLEQLIANFDQADTDQNGLLSMNEARTYAEANGIELPRPPRPDFAPEQASE